MTTPSLSHLPLTPFQPLVQIQNREYERLVAVGGGGDATIKILHRLSQTKQSYSSLPLLAVAIGTVRASLATIAHDPLPRGHMYLARQKLRRKF
jgi:hypothetical protein